MDVPVSEVDLITFARERLAGYKRPREIVFLKPEDMPRNPTGKILHRVLRETIAKRTVLG